MGKNERGQVGVVVAILMVSLFVAVIVLVQVYYVPNWMKDREADHMDTVANQFSQIKASIDIETMAQRDISLINSITLGSKELPFFVSARAFGSLNILSDANSDFQVSIEGDGLPSASIPEILRTSASYDLDNVRTIRSFDLQLDGSQTDDDYFNASLGAAYVNITVSYSENDDFLQLHLRVGNTSEQVVYNQPIAWILNGSEYTVNLLDEGYKFSTLILPNLLTPFNMSFNCTDGGGFILSGSHYNGSIDIQTMSIGTIEYSSENAYFVDQTYVYEGGAVILNQSQGKAIISPPALSIENISVGDSYMHVLDFGLVDVIGLAGKTSVSGYGTYSIRTNYSSMEENEYLFSNLTIRKTSDHAPAWYRFLNNTLVNSDINPSTTDYITEQDSENVTMYMYSQGGALLASLSLSGNEVSLVLAGPYSNENSYDVKLSTSYTDIFAQVGPGWVS